MAQHVIETALDPAGMRNCIAMLGSLGYVEDNQRGNLSNGFFGLRRKELLEIGERFGIEVDPMAPQIETARHFEALFMQGERGPFDFKPDTPEQRLSPRELMAESNVLNVSFLGKSHAALSRDVGDAKALLHEQAEALDIPITDKTLAELHAAVEAKDVRSQESAPEPTGPQGNRRGRPRKDRGNNDTPPVG
tara:strand:+ start:795 stop:1370 length:576 start_codon:yes stop_codon:yes gene_type:complete